MLLTYVIAARISIGAIATACSQDDQPATNPASGPCEKYGKRPVPPATGYTAPNSAYTRAITVRIAAARIHEMMDAGPATSAAFRAPSSHPDPMIEPSEMNISP